MYLLFTGWLLISGVLKYKKKQQLSSLFSAYEDESDSSGSGTTDNYSSVDEDYNVSILAT